MSLVSELQRRNVIKVAMLYGVAGWVILQVADILLPILGAPEWGMRLVFGLLLLGLPVALLLAWKFELTPDGLVPDKAAGTATEVTAATGRRIYVLIGVLAALAVVIMIAGRQIVPASWDNPTVTDAAQSMELAGAKFMNPAPEQSIGVLPFANMSDDPSNVFLSNGIAEEILNELAGVPGLYVAARSSSFFYRDYVGDLAPVARQLRVRHLLEGSVRRSGERIRVTAQLINATDGYHLWSETYERGVDDIFDIEDDIARQVTEQLKLALAAKQTIEGDAPTANTEAYMAYLRGRQRLAMGGIAGFEAAQRAFEEAITLDPEFAGAYANLAMAYMESAQFGDGSVGELEPTIRAAAERALELDDALAHAWVADALAKAIAGPESLTSRAPFESMDRAYAMAPHDSDVMFWRVWLLDHSHESWRAREAVRQALIRDPLSAPMHENLCWMHNQAHKFDQAIEYCLRAAELAPHNPRPLYQAAFVALGAGRFDDSIRFDARALERDPADALIPIDIAGVYVELGDLERAREWFEIGEPVVPDHTFTQRVRIWLNWWAGNEAEAGRQAQAYFDRGFHRPRANELDTDFIREVLVEYRLRQGKPENAIAAILEGKPPAAAIDESTDGELIMKHLLLLPAWQATDPATAERIAGEIRRLIEPEWQARLHFWDMSIARCGLAGFEGRLEDALVRCAEQYQAVAAWPYYWWQISSLFDPIRDAPEWQALIAEKAAARADQLARFRASGDEPLPDTAAAMMVTTE